MEESMAYQSQDTQEVSSEPTYTESLAASREDQQTNQSDEVTNEQETETQEATKEAETEEVTEASVPQIGPVKVKYNHEEMEIPGEEIPTWVQKGLNYDKVFNQLAERDAEVARRFAAQGIKSWDDLIKGWDTTQQQQQVQMLDQQYLSAADQIAEKYGADPNILREIAQELAANHPAEMRLKQLEQENGQIKTQAQIQEKINQDAATFKKAYPDLDYSTIPQEVWDRCNKGYSLMDSYQIHENQLLREKITSLEKANQVKEQNKKNAASSVGSVTGQGATTVDNVSEETFMQKKSDSEWMKKNLSKVTQSKWYTDRYGKPNR